MASQPIPHLTESEYLAREEAAEFRSEYFHGEMFAMSGASMAHVRISVNLTMSIGSRLANRCALFNSDTRVKVGATTLYAYPDLTIVCGQPQSLRGATLTLLNPFVLFEILSPAMEAYDRGKKWKLYRSMESLQQYVLVGQDNALVELFTRGSGGEWTLTTYEGLEAALPLASIGIEVPLAEIYNHVEFTETPPTPVV